MWVTKRCDIWLGVGGADLVSQARPTSLAEVGLACETRADRVLFCSSANNLCKSMHVVLVGRMKFRHELVFIRIFVSQP